MDTSSIILFVVLLTVGLFLNIRIKWLAIKIFKKDDTFARIVIRVIGVTCLINAGHQIGLY